MQRFQDLQRLLNDWSPVVVLPNVCETTATAPAIEAPQQIPPSAPAPTHSNTANAPNAGVCSVVIRDVCKSFHRGGAETLVLKAVNISIQEGQCVFLVGPSGSGKTTLMSIIGCLLTADSGEVQVLGYDTAKLNGREKAALRRKRLGFVFQRFHLIRGLTAAENVAAPLRLDGVRESIALKRAAELLDQVGLSSKLREHPQRMSVGQCQRVALARALAADPEIVLADEPTASLDAESGGRAMRLLRDMTIARGKTLIVVTHDHRIVPEPGGVERIVTMDSGCLVEQIN